MNTTAHGNRKFTELLVYASIFYFGSLTVFGLALYGLAEAGAPGWFALFYTVTVVWAVLLPVELTVQSRRSRGR